MFNQTSAKLHHFHRNQDPQIEGDRQRVVFDGDFPDTGKTVAVTSVSSDGKYANIDAGALVGVTVGSVYRKATPATEGITPPRIEITKVNPTFSSGKTTGAFKVGDLVVLEKYQAASRPRKVFVHADMAQDRELARRLATAVDKLRSFETVPDQSGSEFVLAILRPEKNAAGDYVYKQGHDTLPKSSAKVPPECWILLPSEALYQKDLKVSLASPERGISTVCEDLEKIVRVENLLGLRSGTGDEQSPVKLTIAVYDEGQKTADNEADAICVSDNYGRERCWTEEIKTFAADGTLQDGLLQAGRILVFTAENTGDKPYYVYLYNITSTGQINPVYPGIVDSREAFLLQPGQTKQAGAYLEVDGKVDEYIRLIASENPINHHLLRQEEYLLRGTKGLPVAQSPLDALLMEEALITRGETVRPQAVTPDTWSTVQSGFKAKK